MKIKNVVVIGSGTMGSGIAAHLCNAKVPVTLLDLTTEISTNARERIHKSRPPLLIDKSKINNIKVGNINDNFDVVKDADWIVEAVVERIDIKHQIYEKIFKARKDGAIVSSNTSSIPIKVLSENLTDKEKKDFCITHFFNPVRYMGLLEILKDENNDLDKINSLKGFCEVELGKGAIVCNDTPGFLGNRVGVYAMQIAMTEAFKMKLSVEEADAIFGRPMGIPKTGVFGLYDLIGIDLMSDVVASMRRILPEQDDFQEVGTDPELITSLIGSGYTGQKGLGGFYLESNTGRKVRDLSKEDSKLIQWRDINPLPEIAEKAAKAQNEQEEALLVLIEDDSEYGQFACSVLAHIFCYAGQLLGTITSNPQDIDDAMKLGFNWQRGPFEMIDAIGEKLLHRLISNAGLAFPQNLKTDKPFYRLQNNTISVLDAFEGYTPVSLPEGSFRLQILRRTLPILAQNNDATCYEIEKNMRLIEFHSKANALRPGTVEILNYAAHNAGTGIIIHNDSQHFSAGVDLNHFRFLIENKNWEEIDLFLKDFQGVVTQLKYLPVPVIGVPSGLAIGGGFEVLAHCDALVAHVNSTFGLVESGVGLLPAGGGVKQSYLRWFEKTNDWDEAAWQCWMQIGYGKVGTSPDMSSKYQYFLPDRDLQVMNKDRLFEQAVSLNIDLQKTYVPPKKPVFKLANPNLRKKMHKFMKKGVQDGIFTPHNLTTAMAIADVIVATEGEGQSATEKYIFDRERFNFINLAKTPQTLNRICTLLDSGTAEQN